MKSPRERIHELADHRRYESGYPGTTEDTKRGAEVRVVDIVNYLDESAQSKAEGGGAGNVERLLGAAEQVLSEWGDTSPAGPSSLGSGKGTGQSPEDVRPWRCSLCKEELTMRVGPRWRLGTRWRLGNPPERHWPEHLHGDKWERAEQFTPEPKAPALAGTADDLVLARMDIARMESLAHGYTEEISQLQGALQEAESRAAAAEAKVAAYERALAELQQSLDGPGTWQALAMASAAVNVYLERRTNEPGGKA